MKQHDLFGDDDGAPETPPEPRTKASGGKAPPKKATPAKTTPAKTTAAEKVGAKAPVEPRVAAAAPPAETQMHREDGPGDGEARRRAVTEFDRPLLLAAGAGTGKTATLVARVAHWCLGPGWELEATEREGSREALAARVLRGVAAVTFTEAAAAEMSTRVGQALAAVQGYAAGRGKLPPGFVPEALETIQPGTAPGRGSLAEVDAPESERRAELGARAEALRAALDQLNVSTIHAFCRRILSTHPLEAGFDPDFEVDATFQQAELAVRDAIEGLLSDDWEAGRDEDWIALAKRGFTPPDIEATAVALVTDQGARARDFELDPLPDATCDQVLDELRASTATLRTLAVQLEDFRKKRFNTRHVLEGLDDTAVALETLEHGGREGFTKLAGWLAEAWGSEEREKGWKRFKDWQKKGLNKGETESIADADAFLAAAAAFHAAARPVLEIDVELLDLGRRVVGRVLARVEELLRHRGVATFSDLLTSTRALLSDPKVAARERGRIRQLLVDEFQDTDLEQCDIVAALALEGEARPGLFLVGDPKQSIFAWRNADLGAFDDFVDRLVAVGGERLALNANFRSHGAILDEVERIIGPVMEEVRGLQPAFEPLEPARDGARAPLEAPAVEHWISWPRDEQSGAVEVGETGNKAATYRSEARALARDVVARHAAGEPWSEFALILRSLTSIEVYLRELREAGVPYEVQSERNYYERREVIDAASLVRTLLDPADHTALVGFLRSPAVGMPDAALFPLWEEGLPGELTWLTWPDPEGLERIEALVDRAEAKLPGGIPGLAALDGWESSLVDAVRSIAELRQSFRDDAVDRFVERARELLKTDVVEAARYLGEYRLDNLERFWRDLVRSLEDADGDARRILRSLRANVGRTDRTEAARPVDSGRDALRVLTIHGSKGLQFANVYLGQTHRASRGDSGTGPEFERRGGDPSYRLFGAPSLGWVRGDTRRRETEAAERVRLLYVALTRAERRLVILGAWSEKAGAPEWRRTDTANGLCRSRSGAFESAVAVATALRAGDFEPQVDRFGVAWRLAELEPEDAEDPGAARRGPELESLNSVAASIDRIVDEAGDLAVDRRRAARRMVRPYSSAASAEAHLEGLELSAARRYAGPGQGGSGQGGSEPARPLGRDAAMASGTALHRLLEELPLEGDLAAAWGALGERLEPLVAELAPDGQRAGALERARELFDRIAGGGLLERLAEIGPGGGDGKAGVVARELTVIVPARVQSPASDPAASEEPPEAAPEAGRPGPVLAEPARAVGFVSGAIDLVYRDEDGHLVVADYKTDRAEGERALAELTAGYAAQGAVYTAALQQALDLPERPRFELWYLHAGQIVST